MNVVVPIPSGAWVDGIPEAGRADLRAEIAALIVAERVTAAEALAQVYRRSVAEVVGQVLRGGAPGPAATRRLRAAGALLRELRDAPPPNAA